MFNSRNKVLHKRNNKIMKEYSQPVSVRDLIVSHGAKIFTYGENDECKSIYRDKKPSLIRLIDHIYFIAHIANQTHEQDYFSNGVMLPTAKNSVTRISLPEFSLYTHNTPLTQAEFHNLIAEIDEIAKTCHENLHLLLSSIPVLNQDNRLFNYIIYVECGNQPKVTISAKSMAALKDKNIFPKLKLAKLNNEHHPTSMILPSDEKGVATPINPVIEVTTAGKAHFFVPIDICVEHKYGHAAIMTAEKLSQTMKNVNTGFFPFFTNHIITSNCIALNVTNTVGSVVTFVDASSVSGVYCNAKKIKPSSFDLSKIKLDFSENDYEHISTRVEYNRLIVENPPFGADYCIQFFPEVRLDSPEFTPKSYDFIRSVNEGFLRRSTVAFFQPAPKRKVESTAMVVAQRL